MSQRESDEDLEHRLAEVESELASLKRTTVRRGVRKRSAKRLFGLPLYDIACGPDPEKGELRGHARGIIAIGDIATGFLAIGGVARGLLAIGGVAIGGISLGGCSIGILAAVGGLAIGGLALGGMALGGIALGGGAVGYVACGGGAVGYYACGGGAFGQYVLSPDTRSPEAVEFFGKWLPGLTAHLK
jgi:hypothetical protein